MTRFITGMIEALLICGTMLSITAMCAFSILMPRGRKPGFSPLTTVFLNPWDCVFFPARLTPEGLRDRKRWFISAAATLFFIICDFLAWRILRT